MKKIVFTVFVLFALVAGFDYVSKNYLGKNGLNNFGEQIKESDAIADIKKEVSTSGPLKFLSENSQSYLTRVGTINQTNLQRQKENLPALKENQELNRAALAKVKDMFAVQYFEHVSPAGKGPGDLADDAGYEYIAIGENLALGNFKNDQELVEAWMNSPGHRANIMSGKYTEIGVAVIKGSFEGRQVWLAVQEFGKPKSACPQVSDGLRAQLDLYKQELKNLEPQIQELRMYLENNDPKTKEEVQAHNQKVQEYNDLIKLYNNKVDWLKVLTADYNAQVNAYNTCAGG